VSTDLARHLLRKGIGARAGDAARCARCRRTPLAGELIHVFAHGRVVCALCAGHERTSAGEPLRRERVHAAERRLPVTPRAA
jgi:hypothetical protein